MNPNIDTAAIKAAETLIMHQVRTGPVDPLPIIKSIPGVMAVSFAEMAHQIDLDRETLLRSVGTENHDAMSFCRIVNGRALRFVVFNQRLPLYMLQRGLARELGHIILGHDGSRPEDVRIAEAQTFAYHLLCPRPLVRAIQDSGIRFSTEVLGNATGCFERCLAGMRKTPGAHVPAELNQMVRDQFAEYLHDFLDFQSLISAADESRDADFGSFMDFYEE